MSSASLLLFRATAVAITLVLGTSVGCPGNGNTPTSGPAPVPSQSPAPVGTFAGVFTYHNDNFRTGQNLNESVLTPSNVSTAKFGLRFSIPVDGQIYAQPLYVAGLNIGGQLHNTVFVATEHDSVYAFDGDDPSGILLWRTSFINPSAGITTVSSADVNCTDLGPEIGITSTPVIDPNSGTLYVVAKTKENGSYFHRLHALDLATGTDKVSPVVIQGGVPGNGAASVNGLVSFDPLLEMQRPALLLSDSVLYIAFASLCDFGPYHGWVFAYDAQTLNQRAIFNATPNGSLGGIWQSGGGPAVDASGNVFVMTGNGTFDGRGGSDFGDSFLKLTSGALIPSDFFTPFDQATLQATDDDLGSGSPLLLPDQSIGPPHLLVSAGKEGTIYLLDRDNMGGFNNSSDQIVQSVPGVLGSLFGTPAYFQSTVYFVAAGDALKAFSLNSGRLSVPPVQGATIFGWPGATPVISANGSLDAIVWVLEYNGPAILHAFSATDITTELYNSTTNPNDNPGFAIKFAVPSVANGKVYVGTQDRLSVFGLG